MSAKHTPGRILIDCRDCGGAGCKKCRNTGARMTPLVRPKGLLMPRNPDAFENAREACPCYQGCSINAGVSQCTHADHHDDNEWCEPRACPVAIAQATGEAQP